LLTEEFSHGSGKRPVWIEERRFWLAIPLTHNAEIIGFVLLLEARAPIDLDWEVFELLHTVARQAASYLAEQDAAAALADAKLLEDYSKRFAFVVHDIKNLSSQLELVVSNARRHGDDPEFRADVMLTIEHSVGRMNRLLSQLKGGKTAAPAPVADVALAIDELVSLHPAPERIRVILPPERILVRMDPGNLLSALTHIVGNALEASGATGDVSIAVRRVDGHATIDVTDRGPGMEISFVRNALFRPFRTTKKDGYGIGAFQTREIVRSAGGTLEVLSTPGAGTTVSITLGLAAMPVLAARV
jgi:putative PEP-CTERM system histidine kinase